MAMTADERRRETSRAGKDAAAGGTGEAPSMPVPWRCRVASVLARRSLQRFWERALWVCFAGLGYQNHIPELNGEFRFLGRWLEERRDREIVVFDVGAHEGEFAAFVLKRAAKARVHLFEPNPVPGARLDRRFSGERRAAVNHVAVGEAPGMMTLYDDADQGGSCKATALLAMVDAERVSATEVPLLALDDYCRERGIDAVDYLKVDVEGFERRVFAGAARLIRESRIGVVHFEQNDHALWYDFPLRAIVEVFPHYDIYRLLPDGLVEVSTRRTAYRSQHDFTRLHNLVAIRREGGPAVNSAFWTENAKKSAVRTS